MVSRRMLPVQLIHRTAIVAMRLRGRSAGDERVGAPSGWCGYDGGRGIRMLIQLLERLYDWLSPSDSAGCGDLIFVLAGRQSRKLYALELFRQGAGNNLLLSVGRFEIRKFAQLSWPAGIDLVRVAAGTPAALRHYFVSLEAGKSEVELISRGRFGTLSEIRALVAWLQRRPHMRSLVIVSSGPHLRRVRACCRALLPEGVQLRFLATPDDGRLTRSDWWRDAHSRKLVAKEVGKLFVYRLLLMAKARVSQPEIRNE